MRGFVLAWVFAGCSSGGALQGVIEADGNTAEVNGGAAFAYSAGGALVAYISSNPASTCDDVVDYLTAPDAIDPSDVLLGGTCNVYIALYDGFDGSFQATDDRMIAVSSAIGCAMGDGDFVYEERFEGAFDYYWSGVWWQGFPVSYTWDFSGQEGDDMTLDISMSSYEGGFIYESFDDVPAAGDVSGVVTAEWCPGLAALVPG